MGDKIPLNWTTVQRKINDLIPYQHNPRKLTDEKRDQLIRSLEKFNLAEIPAVNTDGVIIAGHQRIKVLQLLGRGEEIIDVRIPNRPLTEQEFKEYNITSNLQVGVWDVELLEEVFSDIDLKDLGLDVNELNIPEIDNGLTDETEDEVDDRLPEEPITQPGDFYEFIFLNKGLQHKVHCADSRDPQLVTRLMGDDRAHLILTDPPYNVKIDDIVNSGKTRHKDFKLASGELSETEFIEFLKQSFINLQNFSMPGSLHFIFMDWKHIYEILTAGRVIYSEQKQLIVWNKDNGGMGSFYRSKHELCFVFKHGTEKHINNFLLGQFGRYRTNVWDYAGANSFTNRQKEDNGKTTGVGDLEYHPTVKSLEMMADAMLDCSCKGHIILDLFLGSGTNIVAAEQTRRNCYGQELEEGYCDVIVRRWIRYMHHNDLPFKILKNGVELTAGDLEKYE